MVNGNRDDDCCAGDHHRGAVFVLVMSTPIMMALVVIVFAAPILFVGTGVTRQAPIIDITVREDAMCESVDLIAALDLGNVVLARWV